MPVKKKWTNEKGQVTSDEGMAKAKGMKEYTPQASRGYTIGGTRFTDKADYEQAKRLSQTGTISTIEATQGNMIKPAVLEAAKKQAEPILTPEQQAAQAEIGKTIEEEEPVRRELAPEKRFGEEVPVVGGIISVGTNILADAARRGLLGEKQKMKMIEAGALQPELLRTAALTQVESQVYAEGVTKSEKFGALIEGIPIVGSLVSKYASGLIETPTGNVNTLVQNIKTERRRATKYETWSRTGVITPDVAKEKIEEIELNVQRLESRIKLLANFSPELRYNSDGLNKIETELLSTREILLESKLRVIQNLPMTADDYALMAALESFEEE